MTGKLYLCATPIGNLEDLTLRVIRILKEVDLIAAEDTRQTMKLLNHLGIKKAMASYHEHNRFEKGPQLIEKLKDGLSIALVTDAGMPGISDPGEDLVKLCISEGIGVEAVPGATASIIALVLSGFATGKFVFEGFLPRSGKDRREAIEYLKKETRTAIIYESPHRIRGTIRDLFEGLGHRRIAICRELTKKYEEVIRTNLEDACSIYESVEPKGEFVIVLEGRAEEELLEEERKEWDTISVEDHIKMYIDQGLSKKEALKKVASDRGLSKREIYKYTI